MEDEHCISTEHSFFGVYDGHGGAQVSALVRRRLFPALLAELFPVPLMAPDSGEAAGGGGGGAAGDPVTEADEAEAPDGDGAVDVEKALRAAFSKVSDEVLRNGSLQTQGSTAVAILLREGEIWTANLGDSRAILQVQMVINR